eukprot:7682019-Pyramimonas_sp.AAC.1
MKVFGVLVLRADWHSKTAPQEASRIAPTRSKRPLRAPKTAPEGPKTSPEASNVAQEAPKTAPRAGPDEGPKWTHRTLGARRFPSRTPKMAVKTAKMARRCTKGPRWPQDGPRRPYRTARGLQDGPRALQGVLQGRPERANKSLTFLWLLRDLSISFLAALR